VSHKPAVRAYGYGLGLYVNFSFIHCAFFTVCSQQSADIITQLGIHRHDVRVTNVYKLYNVYRVLGTLFTGDPGLHVQHVPLRAWDYKGNHVLKSLALQVQALQPADNGDRCLQHSTQHNSIPTLTPSKDEKINVGRVRAHGHSPTYHSHRAEPEVDGWCTQIAAMRYCDRSCLLVRLTQLLGTGCLPAGPSHCRSTENLGYVCLCVALPWAWRRLRPTSAIAS